MTEGPLIVDVARRWLVGASVGSGPPRAWRRRSPIAFIALTGVLAIPFWIAGALIETPDDAPVRLPVSSLWFVCPVVAAAILTFAESGAPGVRSLVARTVDPSRLRPRWLVASLLLAPAAYAVAFGITIALGRPVSPPSLGMTDIVVLVGIFLLAAFTEEAGWTGYASDPLRHRVGALGAALLLGTVWGLGHVIPDVQGGRDAGWIFWQRGVVGVALRVLIMWAFVNSGAVASALLIHAMDNVSWQLFSAGTTYDPMVVGLVLAAIALLVIGRYGTSLRAGRSTAGAHRLAAPA